MARYLFLQPSGSTGKMGATAPDVTVVRDGFRLLAFLFPLIWFLVHRMWREAILFLVIALVSGGLAHLTGNPVIETLSALFWAVAVGFEAGQLYASHLERKGWRLVAALCAGSEDEAEEIFYAGWQPSAPVRPAAYAGLLMSPIAASGSR